MPGQAQPGASSQHPLQASQGWEIGKRAGDVVTPLQGSMTDHRTRWGRNGEQGRGLVGGYIPNLLLSVAQAKQGKWGSMATSTVDRAQWVGGWGSAPRPAPTAKTPGAWSQHHGQKSSYQDPTGTQHRAQSPVADQGPRGQHWASPGSALSQALGRWDKPSHPSLLRYPSRKEGTQATR